jgi:hypothetical protein
VSASKYESLNPYFWYQSGFGFDFDILDAESIPVHLSEVWGMFFGGGEKDLKLIDSNRCKILTKLVSLL